MLTKVGLRKFVSKIINRVYASARLKIYTTDSNCVSNLLVRLRNGCEIELDELIFCIINLFGYNSETKKSQINSDLTYLRDIKNNELVTYFETLPNAVADSVVMAQLNIGRASREDTLILLVYFFYKREPN